MSVKISNLQRVKFPPYLWFELGVVCVMLMDVTWAALWYGAFTESAVSWLLIAAFFALVLLGSHYLSRILHHLDPTQVINRLVFLGWLAFCLFAGLALLVFPGKGYSLGEMLAQSMLTLGQGQNGMRVFWNFLALALLAWRGVTLARKPLSMGYNVSGFQRGVGAFLLFGLIYGWMATTDALVAFGSFLFIGLVGMSFARIADLGKSKGGRLPPFGLTWLSGILLGALAVVTVSIGVSWLIHGQISDWIAAAVAGLFMILALAFYTLLLPILAAIIELTYRFGQHIFANFDLNPVIANQSMEEAAKHVGENKDALNLLVDTSRGPILAGILLLIVILILVGLSWKPWQRRKPAFEEQSEGIGRSRGQEAEKPPSRKPFSFSPRRLLAAARIRRIYTQLCSLSASLGQPRPAAMTPLEYLPKMDALYPQHTQELALITGAYLQVRYGEVPETNQEVQEVVNAWNRVRSEGRRQLTTARMLGRRRKA